MGVVIGGLFMIGLFTGMCLLDGLVLQVMWGWFLVPLGLPNIGLAMAIGLGAIISLVTPWHTSKPEKGKEIEAFIDSLTTWVFKLVVLLAIGWIAHKYL